MQQPGATSAHPTPKGLSTTSVLATMPVTQGTALPLRGDITSYLLRGQGWQEAHCSGGVEDWYPAVPCPCRKT